MSIEIALARPEDGTSSLADLEWAVDVPVFEYICRSIDNWRRMFLSEWPHPDGIVCHACAHLAIGDGRVLGLLVSHDSADLDERFARSIARWRETESAELCDHLEHAFFMIGHLFPHPPPDSYYVLHLAVDARVHGAGIGRRLMEVAEARARALGRSSLRLDMNADNPAAGFYRRLGMDIEVETRVPALEREYGVGLHYHWVKVLD